MILLCANRAGRTRFVSLSAAIAFLAASATATLADIGIASRYPNDIGIANDPNVHPRRRLRILHRHKSNHQPAEDHGGRAAPANMRLATESDHVYSGTKAIEFVAPGQHGSKWMDAIGRTSARAAAGHDVHADLPQVRRRVQHPHEPTITAFACRPSIPRRRNNPASRRDRVLPLPTPKQLRQDERGQPGHESSLCLLAEAAVAMGRPLVSGWHGRAL